MSDATTTIKHSVVARGSRYERALPDSLDGLDNGGSEPGAGAIKRAIIYLRVSTAEQAERGRDAEGFSIPAQREACYRKAAEIGAEVVDEYVDRGESAKTADRPALTLMMTRLQQLADIDAVIVHKIDRLARNRADDANLTLALYQHGAQLVSCTEQIDSTPSGKLVHGIMASINEWYSANLATEALKGMLQKAKAGGTPGRAPIGYLNVSELVDGRAIPTVVVDPDRAPHVQWAFRAYAGGDFSISALTDELERRGLRTLPSRSRASVSLHRSRVAAMLSNKYYLGIVTFKGVEYQGTHPHLISPELFGKVQAILEDRRNIDERRRVHHHYLKGTIFCRRCGSRMVFSRNRGHGGIYDYFFCMGRRRGCTQPHVEVARVEDAILRYYKDRVSLGSTVIDQLRTSTKEHIEQERSEVERQARRQQKQLVKLEHARKRLLDAYLAGALELTDFRDQQDGIVGEIAAAKRAIEIKEIRWKDVETTFDQVLYLAHHCGEAYELAPPCTRRLLNQALFEMIFLNCGDVVGVTLTEPFVGVLSQDLVREAEQTNPGPLEFTLGSNTDSLAPPTGFEPVLPP